MAAVEKVPPSPPDDGDNAHQKEMGVLDSSAEQHASDSDEPVHTDAQAGVQAMEATASAWTKKALITAYIMIWVIYFVDTMQQGVTNAMTPYVTSKYQSHSLTPTVTIFSSIIGGVWKLTLAKILDIFGRPQGYLLSIIIVTVGLVMMAGCNAVETYAAAQVFYWVGYNGLDYSLSIFIADTSHLKNRSLMFAYASSPYIITTWIAGPIATRFLNGPGIAWGFGTFCIVTPAVTLPLFFFFQWNYQKAKKAGLVPKRASGRTIGQSIVHYAREFDAFGLLLLTAGIVLFLLPFNLYSYQKDQWRSPLIICFLIFGALLIVAFALWERWWAPVQFIPYHLFTDRTVLGACLLSGSIFVSFYIWDSYFSSFLQVVNGLSITEATYVGNIYTIGSCFWSIVVGLYIRRFGSFKKICLYFGVPVTILGVGLMIHFRQPDVNIGYIVMCQIFIAFAGGTIVICEQTAAMAAVTHQYVAVVIAIEGMASSIGNGIGSSITAAIWQSVFPQALGKYLPEEAQGNLTTIYEDLTVQLSYPVGSPIRTAIQHAYGDAQRYMLIAGTVVLIIPLGAVLMWRDINVKEIKQVKGRVI